MKKILSFLFYLAIPISLIYSQTTLDADGPGDTYDLIISVLAPGENPIETPDCSHPGFGDHIEEVFDEDLGINVFAFHIHTEEDDDRCINFDRQRNEIKSYDKSPGNLLGIEGEKVIYKWKFKLASGFQSSPNFTHIHQLKSVGGEYDAMPMYTLTTRKGSPDKLELRYAETDNQITLAETSLTPFIGTWVEVSETIIYGTSGTYELEIREVSDSTVLFEYSNSNIVNWRPEGEFVRPKWGIYRSLINDQDLRDETVLFANFSVEELISLSSEYSELNNEVEIIFSNSITNSVYIKDLFSQIDFIQIYSLDGKQVLSEIIDLKTEINLNVSSLPKGTYILNVRGDFLNQSETFIVF